MVSAEPGQPQSPARRRMKMSSNDITYRLASMFLGIARVIPAPRRARWIDSVSPFLARLLCAANVHSARTIRRNLSGLFGAERAPDRIENDVRRLLSMTVWNSLILNTLPALSQPHLSDLIPVDDVAGLDAYRAEGRPVLIWGFHFGIQPLIVAALLRARGYPLRAITHVRQIPETSGRGQRAYLRQLHSLGDQLSVTDPREGIDRKVLDTLTARECLYVTPDYMITIDVAQPCPPFVVPIDFLGRTAYLQTGSLRLAKRLGAGVVTVLTTWLDGERRLAIEPLKLPGAGLTPADLQHDLQLGMQRLEAQIRTRPGLWLDLKRDDLIERLKPSPESQRDTTRASNA